MSERLPEIREALLSMQEVSPAMHDSYRKDLESMLNPQLTSGSRWIALVLLLLLLGCAGLMVRADLVYHVRGLLLAGHVVLGATFIGASFLILRELRKRRRSPRALGSIAGVLTIGSGILTVAVLLIGLRAPGDPKSLFGAFYVFVFYFACAVWGLESRIGSAELAAREQSLRIEYRLADIAERLQGR